MDNDNKIKAGKEAPDQRHKEVLLFLNEELSRLQTGNSSESYDLEKEYAKTKKNRSFFSMGLLIGSLLVVFLLAWGITAGIEKQNSEITVNLAEFEGLNIKNLLDSVSKVQTNYDTAMKNRTNLVSDKEIALGKAAEKRDSDLFLIDSLTLDAKQTEERKAAVYEEYEAAVALVNETYDSQILSAEKELQEYKKQLDEYDTAKLESARQQEQALDSERRVHQLEMDKLAKRYEDRISEMQDSMNQERHNNSEQMRKSVQEVSQKYLNQIAELDPDLSGEKSRSLVQNINSQGIQAFTPELYAGEELVKDDVISKGLEQFNEVYGQYKRVRVPMEEIPYKNTMPSYLNASQKLVDNMGQVFKDTSVKFYEQKYELAAKINELVAREDRLIKENEAEKAQMRSDFAREKAELAQDYVAVYEGILASAKAQAVVISARSKDNIRIYVIESQRSHITADGVGAEIKGTKTVKGVIKPIADEPGFYRFENALDKNGNPVDFDFDLIATGQTVKVSAK